MFLPLKYLRLTQKQMFESLLKLTKYSKERYYFELRDTFAVILLENDLWITTGGTFFLFLFNYYYEQEVKVISLWCNCQLHIFFLIKIKCYFLFALWILCTHFALCSKIGDKESISVKSRHVKSWVFYNLTCKNEISYSS